MSNAPHVKPLDRLRKGKRRASKRVGIVMDSDFQEAVEEARTKLSRLMARSNLVVGAGRKDPDLAAEIEEAEEELRVAEEQAEEHTERFIAKALAPRVWDDLINKHPPTKDQKQDARKNNHNLTWNPETFPPELISTCVYLVTPLDAPNEDGENEQHEPLTEEFVKEMFDGSGQWNIGEINALLNAGIAANTRGPQGVAGLGNG